MELQQLLQIATERQASDLHLRPTRPPLIRKHRKIVPLDDLPALSPQEIEEMVRPILTPLQVARFEEHLSVDFGYGIVGLARFRGNVYMQRGTMAASFRRIPYDILSIDDLELPPVLLEFCELPSGLVLVTGPTGSGKSTTLAAMIRYIAKRRALNVITIEDPMEFLFNDDKATISQREVGTDTTSFEEALRNAMRQDPDVIMVGEMRDPETVATTITAAETGHLVFSTLHTNSASQTVDRILDTFPAEQQRQVKAQLAQVLKGVISMQLLDRRSGDGLVAALEILRTSPKIADLIQRGESSKLPQQIESSVAFFGMQSMNQSLMALLVHGTIGYREAMEQSPDPDDLSLKLRKMFPQIEEKGDSMASTSDFSQILELQQVQKLYEEQEARVNHELGEKDQEIAGLRRELSHRDLELGEVKARLEQGAEELRRARADQERVELEAKEKIDKLSERVRALNQQIMSRS